MTRKGDEKAYLAERKVLAEFASQELAISLEAPTCIHEDEARLEFSMDLVKCLKQKGDE